MKVDRVTKLIGSYATTDACARVSNVIAPLIEECDAGQNLYPNAGYEAR